MFDDLLDGNAAYRADFSLAGVPAAAGRGLAVVTCIDSRIDPLGILGLRPGDAKIVRNAGARITADVLRSLALAVNFLGVVRIAIVQHTDCALAKNSDETFRAELAARGLDASGWSFLTIDDQERVLREDAVLVRDCGLIGDDVDVGTFVYDVDTGALRPVVS